MASPAFMGAEQKPTVVGAQTAQDTRRRLSQVVKEAESMVDAALPHLDPVDTEPTRAGHAPSMWSKFPQDIPSVPGPSGIGIISKTQTTRLKNGCSLIAL